MYVLSFLGFVRYVFIYVVMFVFRSYVMSLVSYVFL